MVLGNLLFILQIICVIWLIVLTWQLYRMISHYNRLTKGISQSTLKEIMDEIRISEKSLTTKTNIIEKQLSEIDHRIKFHIQKIGIVRFNPFSDTGGSQSFCLAFLDAENNGIVITSLYARTGNRWYSKYVKNGQGVDLELSREEKSAIQNSAQVDLMKGKTI